MPNHPLDNILVTGLQPNKAALRDELKKYARDFVDAATFNTYDLPDVTLAVIDGQLFLYDPLDLTTPDNGTTGRSVGGRPDALGAAHDRRRIARQARARRRRGGRDRGQRARAQDQEGRRHGRVHARRRPGLGGSGGLPGNLRPLPATHRAGRAAARAGQVRTR